MNFIEKMEVEINEYIQLVKEKQKKDGFGGIVLRTAPQRMIRTLSKKILLKDSSSIPYPYWKHVHRKIGKVKRSYVHDQRFICLPREYLPFTNG